jgi:hypothetical protein
MISCRIFYLTFGLASGLFPMVWADASIDVTVAGEMTDAGRTFAHPASDHPIYYIGVFRGFTDRGRKWGQGDPEDTPLPSVESVRDLVQQTLAAQGYLPAVISVPNAGKAASGSTLRQVLAGSPSLILNIYWGFASFAKSLGPEAATPSERLIESQAYAGGNFQDPFLMDLINAHSLSPKFSELTEDAEMARYYIIIDAYHYAAYARGDKRPLLWRTKMSVPASSLSVTFAGTLQPMLAAGGPAFGQYIPYPLHQAVPLGQITVGEPVVVKPKQ